MSIDFESFDSKSYRDSWIPSSNRYYILHNQSYKIFHEEKRIHIYYDVDQTTVILINATYITYIIHVIQYKVKKYCRKSRAKTAFIKCK